MESLGVFDLYNKSDESLDNAFMNKVDSSLTLEGLRIIYDKNKE